MTTVVQFASGDPQKASLLATVAGTNRTFIVFDYDNLDHLDDCKVLGFKVRKSISRVNRINIAREVEEYVHSMVTRWKAQNKQHGLSFPHQEKVYLALMPLASLLGTC